MNITNNLKDDILHAPDWFHQAIQDKPEDKIFEHKLGNRFIFSKWATSSANKNLIVYCMVVELTKNGGIQLGRN